MFALAGCASAEECPTCPTAQLTANGATELTVTPGTMIAYAWTSMHADTASSTATMTAGSDACGNKNGPWVITTPNGMTDPLPILACQSGTTYTLELVVEQTATSTVASSTVTIAVD